MSILSELPVLFEQDHDQYLKSAIMAKYARFLHNPEANGGKELSLDVVADMIRYYANSVNVTSLYLVKLTKKSPTGHPARLVLHYPHIQLSVVPFILPIYVNSPGNQKMLPSEACDVSVSCQTRSYCHPLP